MYGYLLWSQNMYHSQVVPIFKILGLGDTVHENLVTFCFHCFILVPPKETKKN